MLLSVGSTGGNTFDLKDPENYSVLIGKIRSYLDQSGSFLKVALIKPGREPARKQTDFICFFTHNPAYEPGFSHIHIRHVP